MIIELLPQSLRLALRAYRYRRRGEPEVRWLDRLVDPERASVDVGANNGVYTWWMARLSRHCYSFEPNPSFLAEIRASAPNVTAHAVALSNRRGNAALFIPADARTGVELSGLASLRDAGDGQGRSITVERIPLDELDLPPVGFIKIDVEGHENDVLAGARATITRDRPLLLVEAEERHRRQAVTSLIAWFGALDFTGFWLEQGHWRPLCAFRCEQHQRPADIEDNRKRPGARYYNNFLFVPQEKVARHAFLPQPPTAT